MENNKELLLKDLCARLHFGVYVNYKNVENKEGIIMLNPYNIQHIYSGWWKKYKPYLRSMSSMTEEEWQEYQALKMTDWVEGDINGVFINAGTITDWLNKNMFDYRGLIPKGLAIEVTESNNPYKD